MKKSGNCSSWRIQEAIIRKLQLLEDPMRTTDMLTTDAVKRFWTRIRKAVPLKRPRAP